MERPAKQLLDSQVTKEPVDQIVEFGAPITHVGDEMALLQSQKKNLN